MPLTVTTPGSHPSSAARNTLVYLNVYDLTNVNSYMYWMGFGIFHSAIEVHGIEYAFGAHDYPTTGVFEVEPRNCPGFTFRRTIELGTTSMDSVEVRDFMDRVASEYNGNAYHLIAKNCNHFSDDLSVRLTGRSIPGWVNRLANIGAFCNCLLPESLQVTAVRHTPEYHSYEAVDGQTMSEQEQVDTDSDDDQQLLVMSNGDIQSAMRDQVRDTALKQIKGFT